VKLIVYNELLNGVTHLRVNPAINGFPFFLISKYYSTIKLRKRHKAAEKRKKDTRVPYIGRTLHETSLKNISEKVYKTTRNEFTIASFNNILYYKYNIEQ